MIDDPTKTITLVARIAAELPTVVDVDALAYAVTLADELLPVFLARVRELETGLRHYGQHDSLCGHWKRGSEPLRPCTCGLAEILA